MTKQRKFKREYSHQLIRIAEGDLASARALNSAKLGRPENILFHAQQCIEKCLKAVLCWKGIPVPLVHETAVILDKFPDSLIVPDAENMKDLDQFATIRRYEEGFAVLSGEEISLVIDLSTHTLDWAKKIILQ